MAIDETVLRAVQSLYDAALDASLWQATLRELTELTGSQGGSFWVLDRSEQLRLPAFTSVHFNPEAIEEYLNHLVALDPTVQYLAAHPEEPIVHDGLLLSEREKDRHPYYAWHDRAVGTRFRMVAQMRPAPAIQSGVALHRTPQAGRYEPADLERFGFLYGHLTRALTIAFRLGSLGALAECTTELLDRNRAGIVLLDEQSRAVYVNPAAERVCAQEDGIGIGPQGLYLARKKDNDRLQALIARARTGVALAASAPGGVMRAPRPSGKRAFSIVAAPVKGHYPRLAPMCPSVCVTITDPEDDHPPDENVLRELFGLTGGEARLAVMLGQGLELRSAADRLGITYGTARARLATVFSKTETRRQSELIRLILTVAPFDRHSDIV